MPQHRCCVCHRPISQTMGGTWLDATFSSACDNPTRAHQPNERMLRLAEDIQHDVAEELELPANTVMFVVVVKREGTYKMIGSLVDDEITGVTGASMLRQLADRWEQEHDQQIHAQLN